MKTIVFENGDKVRCTPGCGDRSGMRGEIIGERTLRKGFGADEKQYKMSYLVKWADGDVTPATQIALEPAPPIRGDMDTKVGWTWLAPDVERAIKTGPVKDY